jgi:hypothetical protein
MARCDVVITSYSVVASELGERGGEDDDSEDDAVKSTSRADKVSTKKVRLR